MVAISVIIPTYNCAEWLAESIESVLSQRKVDTEVIVVDDGSTDGTAELLRTYDTVKVLPANHGGIGPARNLGLAHARGEWIAFHDADDVALHDRLEFQYGFMTDHPEWDAIFCNGERLDSPGRKVVPGHIASALDHRRIAPRDLFVGYPVYFQGALVRRTAFVAAGPFESGFPVQPDIEYGYRLFANIRAVFVDRVVFHYRWHTTNNSRDLLRGREDIARILEKLCATDPDTVRAIGDREVHDRIATLYYKVARDRLRQGERERAREALRRALGARWFYPRGWLLQLRTAL